VAGGPLTEREEPAGPATVSPGRPLLLVILGSTGAGKSAVAHEVARLAGGEVISADAFAVYRGLDIGTAKPSARQRAEVPYHLVDIVRPDEHFSAGQWAREAARAAGEIAQRGKLPIVCGGSGFYISALLDGLPPGEAKDPNLRRPLAAWAGHRPEAAHRFLKVNDPLSASRISPANIRYTVRALEILLATGSPASARRRPAAGLRGRWRVIMVGIAPERSDLYARIAHRVREMLEAGWGEEVRRLLESGLSNNAQAFEAIGYREVADCVAGGVSQSETEEKIVTATRQLAKRQKTWFSRERDVRWVRPEEALPVILTLLEEAGGRERSG